MVIWFIAGTYLATSPSMRRVWIEMVLFSLLFLCSKSPSMRRVWIEIIGMVGFARLKQVTLHAEGVD